MPYTKEKVEFVIKNIVKENKISAMDYLLLCIEAGKILFGENKKLEGK